MSKSTIFSKGGKNSGSPTFEGAVDDEASESAGAPDEPEEPGGKGVGHFVSKPGAFHKKGFKALAKTAFPKGAKHNSGFNK